MVWAGDAKSGAGAALRDVALALPPGATERAARRRGVLVALVENCVNRLLAALLLTLSLPIMVPIGLAVLVTSGRPIFYRGARLGRGKRPFLMYKFRTLVVDAEQRIGGRMLSRKDNLVTPIGWFLRDTRLDELPQLINILKGQMNFIGPRPVRPQVYEELCRGIRGYDVRFTVKPGLIGYSQVFTPHNTPKRIRTLIDNRMMGRGVRPFSDLMLIVYTALVVLGTTVRQAARYAYHDLIRRRTLRRYRERRRLARVQPVQAAAIVSLDGNGARCRAPVVDMNDSSFVMRCGETLDPLPEQFDLVIRVGRQGRIRRVNATCRGVVAQVRQTPDAYEYVVHFEPASDRSLYVVHQHFLKRSLAMA